MHDTDATVHGFDSMVRVLPSVSVLLLVLCVQKRTIFHLKCGVWSGRDEWMIGFGKMETCLQNQMYVYLHTPFAVAFRLRTASARFFPFPAKAPAAFKSWVKNENPNGRRIRWYRPHIQSQMHEAKTKKLSKGICVDEPLYKIFCHASCVVKSSLHDNVLCRCTTYNTIATFN